MKTIGEEYGSTRLETWPLEASEFECLKVGRILGAAHRGVQCFDVLTYTKSLSRKRNKGTNEQEQTIVQTLFCSRAPKMKQYVNVPYK